MVEIIGVLTIVAVLTVVVTESVLTRIRQTQRQSEAASLATIANAWVTRVERTRTVPAVTNWATFVAADLDMRVGQVTTSPVGNDRVFLFDPTFQMGPSATLPPFNQTLNGSVALQNPRAVIVGSAGVPLPDFSNVAFTNLWNCAPDALPTDWPSWDSVGADLKIERVDLRHLFHRIVLQNHDNYNTARYSINTTNTMGSLASGGRLDAWFIHGSILNLHYSNTQLQAAEVILEDASYVFENGRWGRYVLYGRDNSMGPFGTLVDAYLAAPQPPPNGNQFGSNKRSIVDEMFYYMWNYARWSERGFPKGGTSSDTQVPEYRSMLETTDRLNAWTFNLNKGSTGGGGGGKKD